MPAPRLRGNVKWTPEIVAWLHERCPAREHGYTCRREILDELNARFETDFSLNAFVTHCYEAGVFLGFASSQGSVPQGEKHWRHRNVGELQVKKGYVRIKVAEPNVWMQYSRWIWEQHHPGQSAEGKRIIFMDGNNRNFDPENLECITPAEQSVMATLGCTVNSTREEREIYLLRARVAIGRSKLAGGCRKSGALKAKLWRQTHREEFRAAARARYAEKMAVIRADPELYEAYLARQQAYRDAHRDRLRANSRAYYHRHKGKLKKGEAKA